MQIPGKIVGGALKAVGLVPKRPRTPAPTPLPTRSDAAQRARTDALRSRRGGAADFLTGSSGAEAAATSIKELLGR